MNTSLYTVGAPSRPEVATVKQAACMYGTYQRATSGWPVRMLTPKRIAKGIHGRLKPEARRAHAFRAARHMTIRGAIALWREELETLRLFKL